MSIDIKELSEKDLQQKIENIKAEREKTANALKRYEEELERRKKEVPLGVPLEGSLTELPYDAVSRAFLMWFSSYKSADKFENGYLANFVKALQDIAEGKPIDVKALLPLLPKDHWVACDSSGEWFVFSCKPFIRRKAGSKDEGVWDSELHAGFRGFLPFNLKPAENWEESLQECGL